MQLVGDDPERFEDEGEEGDGGEGTAAGAGRNQRPSGNGVA
jgi:hypothetical protein